MKYIIILLYIFFFIITTNSLYASCQVLGINLDNKFNGASSCNHMQFKQKVMFNGASTINDSVFKQEATFRGASNISSSNFKKKVNIKGFLTSYHCTFTLINFFGTSLTLTNTQVQSNIIINYKGLFTTPEIFINDHSNIKGNITFIGHNGKVFISKTSHLKGKVINGKVIKVQSK